MINMIERRHDDIVMPGEEMKKRALARLERKESGQSVPYALLLAARSRPMKRATWNRLAESMGLER